MNTYTIQVFADSKPYTHLLASTRIEGSDPGVALRKAYQAFKPLIKGRVQEITIKVKKI